MFKRTHPLQPRIIPDYMSQSFDTKLDWVLRSNAAVQLSDAFARNDYPKLKEDLKQLFSAGKESPE